MNKLITSIIIIALSLTSIVSGAQEKILWYTQPAEKWMEALPVGNGRLGAMVFGGIEKETIQLNEESVWAGPPVPEAKPEAWKSIEKARELIFSGKYVEADEMVQKNVMSDRIAPRSYQTLGDLNMKFQVEGKTENYRRELDLDRAIAKTTFTLNGVTFTREIFSSPVDQVIVILLTADKPQSISVDLNLSRPADFNTATDGKNKLKMWGQAQHNGKHLGVKYETQLLAVPKGGKMLAENGSLKISKANSVTLYLAAATDYNAADPSAPLKASLSEKCSVQLSAANRKSTEKIVADHLAEYQRLFRRVEINLGTTTSLKDRPTNERLKAVVDGADDPELMALYFQFGRYLLISSSRPGNLPANLQGIWNNSLSAPWNSDYHTNINFQMNYWLAEVCNLSECHLPFFDFVESLVPSGQKTAAEVYNCKGFVVNYTTDVWHWTVPEGRVQYGMWPFGGAWCTQHFMEHYRFTSDKKFLAERAYPILKESSRFLLDWLTVDPRSGKLVSGPSSSPENKFYVPGTDKKFANLDMGNAMDQEIIWDNFTNTIEAAAILEIDDDFVSEVKTALANLALPKIGSDGRLMEWSQEFDEVDPGHRHLSHLFGLYPGKQFNKIETPFMIDAVYRSINHRLAKGGGHTGWSRAWIINFFARLQDSEKSYENIKALLQKSTADNLFDMHPPFQIDGNFGGTAGIAEMLLQSHLEDSAGNPIISLLPALPVQWSTGSVKGLCARGGFEVDMDWAGNEIKSLVISSKTGGSCQVRFQEKTIDLTLKKGEKKVLNEML